MLLVRSLKTLPVCLALGAMIFLVGCESETNVESSSDSTESDSASLMPLPKSAPSAGYQFEAPVRIKAGGEYVSVESPGYACPTMADVDGDGLEDLVVGQFRKGYMQFCKNVASPSEPPKFAAADWIMSEDKKAEVPGVW